MSEDRNHISLRSDYVREILPSYFVTEYPTLIKFLDYYYDELNSDNKFGKEIKDLIDIRDIGSTELKYLDSLFGEIGLGLSKDFVTNPREILKNLAKFFRVKGSLYSIEGFFRGIFDTYAEVEYPKDKIFSLGDPDAVLGGKGTKTMQDGELYQVLSILVKTSLPLNDWEQLYKKFVHPVGFYLYCEAQLVSKSKQRSRGIVSDTTPLNLRTEQDSDIVTRVSFDNRIISKTDIGNIDIITWDGPKNYQTCNSGTRIYNSLNVFQYVDSNWFVSDSTGAPLEGGGYSSRGSVDAGLYDPKNINIAALNINQTLETEDSLYNNQLLTQLEGGTDSPNYSIFEAAPAILHTTNLVLSSPTIATETYNIPQLLNKTLEQITRGDSKTYISRIYMSGNFSSNSLCIGLPGQGDSAGNLFMLNDAATYNDFTTSTTAPVLRIDNILDSVGNLEVLHKLDQAGTGAFKLNFAHKFNNIYEWIKYDSNAVFDINSFNYGDNQNMRSVTIQEVKRKKISYLNGVII
jgi:hypothetical protein